MGLACAPCSAIRTPPCLHAALTQSPVPGHVLARRQLIGLSKKPTGWGAAILQREALGVQGHTLSRAQVASSWRLTLVCGPCLALLPFVWPWGACGQEKPCTHPQLHGRTPGQAPGLPWRTAVFGAVAVPVSEVQPAPRPPRPPSAPGKPSDSEQLSLRHRRPSAGPGTTARASDGRARPGNTPPRLSPLSVSSAASSLCVPANCSSPHPLGERSSDCPPRARRCPWADVAQTDRTPPPWGWHGAGGVSIQT